MDCVSAGTVQALLCLHSVKKTVIIKKKIIKYIRIFFFRCYPCSVEYYFQRRCFTKVKRNERETERETIHNTFLDEGQKCGIESTVPLGGQIKRISLGGKVLVNVCVCVCDSIVKY